MASESNQGSLQSQGELYEEAHVLVVDDENGPRQALRMLLKPHHDVLVVESVSAARRVFRHQAVDVVITDIMMPGESGMALVKWVKANHPDVQVIILTGYGQLDTAMEAVEYGACAYVEKPFDSDYMLRRVEEAIDKRRREQERRNLEALALEANRFETLGRFVSGMLHDLGTPLSVIGSQLELTLDSLESGDLRRRLEIMQSQTHYCSDIVRSAMNFLRQNRSDFTYLEINQVVEACLEVAQPVFQREQIAVETELAEAVPMIKGDFILVRQAILNLLVNAHQAMENQRRPRRIWIRTWEEFGQGCLSVEDTGPGIPEAQRRNVFKTFYTTREGAGTGLGLAAVSHIMHRHHGNVLLGEGRESGALFTLRFPGVSVVR